MRRFPRRNSFDRMSDARSHNSVKLNTANIWTSKNSNIVVKEINGLLNKRAIQKKKKSVCNEF